MIIYKNAAHNVVYYIAIYTDYNNCGMIYIYCSKCFIKPLDNIILS